MPGGVELRTPDGSNRNHREGFELGPDGVAPVRAGAKDDCCRISVQDLKEVKGNLPTFGEYIPPVNGIG